MAAGRKEYEMMFALQAQLGGNFTGTFTKAQQQLAAMQKELDALSRRQGDIAAYEKQQAAVGGTQKKLEALQQQYGNIQKEMAGAGAYSSDLANKMLAKQQQIDKTSGSLAAQAQKLDQMGAALRCAGVDTENLGKASAGLEEEIGRLKKEQEGAAEKALEFGSSASQAFGAVQQALVAAGVAKALKEIYDFFAGSAKAAMEFEQAMAGVRRTVGGTDAELAAMSAEFKAMSLDMPITTSELAKIAEAAGQLGVARDDVGEFTRVMAMLATTTDLSADNAATMLAQFANITGLDPKNYARLGAVVADLGDATATTASKVVDMSQGLAAAASLAGMSEVEILGISAAVGSLGIESQAGSTAMSVLIQTLHKAVETGKGLEDFAAVANMSAQEFVHAWGENAVTAMDSFIQGLNDTERNGRSAVVILDELGITNVRQTKAVLGLAKAGDLLSNTVRQGNKAWEENTALQAKADIMYGTSSSQLVMMQNAYNNLKVAVGDNFTPALQKVYAAAANVLKGVTEFIQKNPKLVKAVAVFAGVLGGVVAALAAYSAAAKVAAAASALLSASIPGLNVILAVTAGVAALAGAVAAFASINEDAVPSVKELTEATLEMREAFGESAKTYSDTETSLSGTAALAGTYLERLKELESEVGSNTAAHGEYALTVEKLNSILPDLNLAIDEQTGLVEGGTAAIEAQIGAWKRLALEQALQDKFKAQIDAYAKAQVELYTNKAALNKAEEQGRQLALDEARYLKETARLAKLKADALGDTAMSSEDLAKKLYDIEDKWNALDREYGAIGSRIAENERLQDNLNTAIADGSAALAEYDGELQQAREAMELFEQEQAAAADAQGQSTQAQIMQAAEVREAIAAVKEKAGELAESYNAAYDAALKSVGGQYDLWDKAAKVTATSAGSMNKAMEGQINYWQDYNAGLAALTEKAAGIEGLGDVIASFADGSKESVNAVAGMAKANDADLKKMAENWKKLQKEQETAAGSIAELKTDFDSNVAEMQTELETAVKGMDLGAEAAEAARKTIEGFITGAKDMAPAVQAAYAAISRAGLGALGYSMPGGWGSVRSYIDGSHAGGLDYVPYDGYIAEMHKGERIISAEDNRIVTMTPQLMDAMSAASARNSTAEAVQNGGDRAIYITLAPQYHTSGVGADQLEGVYGANNDSLREMITEVLEDIESDNARRRYR